MPTVGSLFAGVGGFDLGMEQAGFKVLWQAEWDKHCQSVLRRHWPDCALYGDVTDVNGAEIAPVDVITFGSPCQDLSVAGKRAGLDGDRSSMFFQAIRIIKEMQDATAGTFPRIAIWENVPGALSSNRGADFGVVLNSLANVGALAIEWAVLDAQHFGVPQRRRRVFVVAVFDPSVAERCPEPLLPVGEGRRRNSAKGKPKRKGTAGRSADSTRGDRTNWAAGDDGTDTLRTAITSKWSEGSSGPSGDEAYNLIVKSPAIPVLPGQQELFDQPFVKSRRAKSTTDYETWVEGEVSPTLNVFDNATETRATVVVPTIIFDSGSHGFPRESKDVVPTLTGCMDTGGNNTPLAAQPLVYDGYNQDLDDSGVHRTLRIGRDSSDFVAQPILFEPGAMSRLAAPGFSTDVASTLRAHMGDNQLAVAQPIEPVMPTFKSGGGGDNSPHVVQEEVVAPTLTVANNPSRSPQSSEVTEQIGAVFASQYAVRRLTPLECERLMGWPDDHTRWTDDGRELADSHRYRQCGNGVATPVAAWIGSHLLPLLEANYEQ